MSINCEMRLVEFREQSSKSLAEIKTLFNDIVEVLTKEPYIKHPKQYQIKELVRILSQEQHSRQDFNLILIYLPRILTNNSLYTKNYQLLLRKHIYQEEECQRMLKIIQGRS